MVESVLESKEKKSLFENCGFLRSEFLHTDRSLRLATLLFK